MPLLLPSAVQSSYMDFGDVHAAFAGPGSDLGHSILSGGTEVVLSIVNVLLPVAIVYFAWRLLYLFIFVLIGRVDPLNCLPEFISRLKDNAGSSYYSDDASTILLNNNRIMHLIFSELKHFALAVFFCLCVWSLIHLAITGVSIFLNYLGG